MARGSFCADISRFVAKAKDNADEVVRRSVTTLATKVVLRSPVKTGLFRGNWQLGVGGPVLTRVTTLDPMGASTVARVRAAMDAVDNPAGMVFHLTNCQPYGPRLEYDGWSRQAPNGMVGISVREFPHDVAAIAKAMQ